MERIVMVGTGHGLVWNLYNTCFLLENGNEKLLVDTGGGVEIVKNIEKAGYKMDDINSIFISHCHSDHILGLIWILKKLCGKFMEGYDKDFTIYCNEEVAEAIKKLYTSIFSDKIIDLIEKSIKIHVLYDGETLELAGENITFFDAHPKGNKLFGFETILKCGKKLVFLGDEECNPVLYNIIKNADFVMHEAFCLDADAEIFKPYEKHHSTVKSVCEKLNDLNIKNLIIYHTEDTHENKKELYTKEAKQYFTNNVIVPEDMEIIELDS